MPALGRVQQQGTPGASADIGEMQSEKPAPCREIAVLVARTPPPASKPPPVWGVELVRRPTLTASARAGVSEVRVGTKKRASRSNKETDERSRCAGVPKLLDKQSPIQGASGSNREAESTDAPERGGLPCSSAEAGVMLVERRGQVIAVGSEPTGNRRSSNSRRKAAAFVRWHEPDDARVSSPDL